MVTKQAHVATVVALGLFASATLLLGAVPLTPNAPNKHAPIGMAKRETDRLDSALVQAAEQDDFVQVTVLLKRHASPNAALGDETTPLHWAAYNDDLALTKLLLASGAKADARTRLRGLTPLHMAAENGDAALIDALLQGGATADATNDSGTTPLMIAAASGSTTAVATLLAHRADMNAREKTYGQTALFFAADRNREDVVRLLLSKGADPKVKTTIIKLERVSVGVNGEVLDDKKAPQAGIKRESEPASTKPSEDAKAAQEKKSVAKQDDKVKDAYGFTVADRKKRVYGTQQIGGMTALLVAARDGQRDAVSALLDSGGDINQTSDTDHATALILALINGHYDLAQSLLEHGADPKLATSDGVTPLFALIDVQWAPIPGIRSRLRPMNMSHIWIWLKSYSNAARTQM
jgi:ankyrin repeat protein